MRVTASKSLLIALALFAAGCGNPQPAARQNGGGAGSGSGSGPVAGAGGVPGQGGSSTGGAPTAGTSAGGASTCAPGTTPCGALCANTLTDAANCGACGTACGAQESCVNGACQCAAGFLDCNGVCTESNAQNCGMCGNACAPGLVCSGGMCQAGCAPGLSPCDGSCFDLTGHRAHCGSCTTACPQGQDCWQSMCGCPQGQAACSGSMCQDVWSDEANCGSCGNVCVSGATCTQGVCTCPSGQSPCTASNSCKDLLADEQNCGTCGTVCGGSTQCLFGGCVDPNSVNCGGGSQTNNKCTAGAENDRGPYYVSNNLWNTDGASGSQCIWDTCTAGDLIGWGTNWNWSGQANQVKSFASVVFGWHWRNNTSLGVRISSSTNINCGWQFTPNLGGGTDTLNVAYDLWAHTIPNPDSSNTGANVPTDEIMVWLYRNNGAGPISSTGQPTATMTIGGHNWALYEGNTTLKVFSFVRTTNATTAVLNMMDFPRWLANNGSRISSSKYISSVEAGTEIFVGEGQIETNGFYCRMQ